MSGGVGFRKRDRTAFTQSNLLKGHSALLSLTTGPVLETWVCLLHKQGLAGRGPRVVVRVPAAHSTTLLPVWCPLVDMLSNGRFFLMAEGRAAAPVSRAVAPGLRVAGPEILKPRGAAISAYLSSMSLAGLSCAGLETGCTQGKAKATPIPG